MRLHGHDIRHPWLVGVAAAAFIAAHLLFFDIVSHAAVPVVIASVAILVILKEVVRRSRRAR